MRPTRSCGLTIVEIMIVVAVLGLLAAVAVPMWSKARVTAQTKTCLENQRALYLAVSAYESELNTNLSSIANNGVSIRNTIIASGYLVKSNAFGCPTGSLPDFDDYQLRYSGIALTGTYCTIQPTVHIAP